VDGLGGDHVCSTRSRVGLALALRSRVQLARRRIDHLCGNEFAQCSGDDVDAAAESPRRQLACGHQPIGRCATDSEDGRSPGDSKQQW